MKQRLTIVDAGALLLFCAVFASLVTWSTRTSAPTYDETSHLTAGYTYLAWHDYRLNPEHPPLVKMWAALPLVFSREPWPSLTTADETSILWRAWKAAGSDINAQWPFAHEFVFDLKPEARDRLTSRANFDPGRSWLPDTADLQRSDYVHDVDRMFGRGRVMVMLFGLGLIVLVYFWARQVFGLGGAIISTALCCFDPNLIAHSGLVTTDLPVTLFIFGSIFFLSRLVVAPTGANSLGLSAFVGLAFCTKFSAVILLPVCLTIGGAAIFFSRQEWRIGRYRITGKPQKAMFGGGRFLATALITWLMIWAMYGFRFAAAVDAPAVGQFDLDRVLSRTAALRAELNSASSPNEAVSRPDFEERVSAATQNNPRTVSGRFLAFARDHRLLPEAYIFGIANTEMKSLVRGAFLLGSRTSVGFRAFFLWSFLLKTPIAAILLILAGLSVCLIKRPRWALAFIIAPVAVYLLLSVAARLSIGHRHILPVYPFLYLACGSLGLLAERLRKPARMATLAGLVAILFVSNQFIFAPLGHVQRIGPHFLAYFNEFSGGPRNGYKALVDSNLDWGQDLKGLADWEHSHPEAAQLWLSYFGTADPHFYSLRHRSVPKVLGGYEFERAAYDQLESENRRGDAVQQFVGEIQTGDYIAVSATNSCGVYLGGEPVRQTWQNIIEHCTLVDQVGYSIFVYRVNDH